MNVYICIRTILHTLLFIINLSALTTASLFISALSDKGRKATAGSVLVLLGSCFYAIVTVGLWSELFYIRSKFAKVKTEIYAIIALFFFQLIGAIVSTTETTQTWTSCRDQTFCVALTILSWFSLLTLMICLLTTLSVAVYHSAANEKIWDATALDYNWFLPPSNTEQEQDAKDDMAAPFPLVPEQQQAVPPLPEIDLERGIGARHPPPVHISPVIPEIPDARKERRHSSWMPLAHADKQPPAGPSRSGIEIEMPVHELTSTTSVYSIASFPWIVNGYNVDLRRSTSQIPVTGHSPTSAVHVAPETNLKDDPTPRRSILSMYRGIPNWAKLWSPARRAVVAPFPVAPRLKSPPVPSRYKPEEVADITAPVSPAPVSFTSLSNED